MLPFKTALIIGAGAGISASVARALSAAGLQVALAARNPDKLEALAGGHGEREGFPTSLPFATGKFALRGLA